MAAETIRPGWAFKEDTGTVDYVDNRIEFKGSITTLKIINDGDTNDLQFAINRGEDTSEVDGVVKPGETLNLPDIDQGLNSIAVKGVTDYRFWAYH